MDDQELDVYIDRLKSVFHPAIRKLNLDLAAVLEEGLTAPQFFLLQQLHVRGRCTVSELAEGTHVQPSAITAIVDRLVKNGFVERERDEQDRRIVLIGLSEKGRAVFLKSQKNRKEVMKRYLNTLSRQDLDSLLTIFEKLAQLESQVEHGKEASHTNKKRPSE